MPTALIVEDEPDANTLLSMLVQMRGYRPQSALGGIEALDLLHRHRPDVVLLDLMLPDLSGYEVCRAIKSARETTLIPVVVVSAARVEENEARCYAAGANDFVPKPYTPDQIFRALSAADAWRKDVGRRPAEGCFSFDLRDPLEPLRELSRLRSLLRAWTPLPNDSLCAVIAALRDLWDSASSWGRHHEGNGRPIASVHYRLESDRLVCSIEDRSEGWLLDDPLAATSESLQNVPADLVATERHDNRLVLVCRHAPVDPEPEPDLDPDSDLHDTDDVH
ncbi:response regulator [Tautonia marina]|uniref:response regulator n=1 Tax=Tautonia marina TaxID=2653855 RepID=UPI0012606250|nr:response regulator [Tautonia marina]